MGSSWHPLLEPLNLSRQSVDIVHLTLQAGDDRIAQLQSILSTDEAERAARFVVPAPRRHFILCRALLRQLLGACLKCDPAELEFVYGPHGKPELKPGSSAAPVQFSVSHSADQALIAITVDRPVGVDIEFQDPAVRILKLARRFFSPCEASELAELPPEDQLAGFYRGWTCKEAYLKATGLGLSFPLSQFSVLLSPRQPARLLEVVDEPGELDRWELSALDPLPGFAAAVMVEAPAARPVSIRQWRLPPL